MTERSLILFAHGARDVRWAAPFQRLREMTAAAAPGVTVELAFLEFMTPDLPSLVARLVVEGHEEVTLVPVFLGQGGHVLRDLPVMVDNLRRAYPTLRLNVVEAAGENTEVLQAICRYCLAALPTD